MKIGILLLLWRKRALVAAGMSMLWAPQNSRAYPVYGYRGKGYRLMNLFDPNVGGAMVVAALPEGQPSWVDQIRDNFLHPSSESMVTYANTVLGDDGEDETDVDTAPTREELILLSSEESASSYQDLINRSSHAGPQRGASREPVGEGVSNPVVDPQAAAAKQTETKKKKKGERTEEKRLRSIPSREPDDDATLTEMMKKRRVLEDKKCELDAQAAAMLSEKKSKFMGQAAAPFESEIDLGVFSKKSGNHLEKISKASSAPRCMISFVKNVIARSKKCNVHAEGAETNWESSEATPQRTVYTKRVHTSGSGGASGRRQGPKIHRVEG
ncbi:hypothetical protein Hanom_Chr06g00531211 [Helianthus anomalus]